MENGLTFPYHLKALTQGVTQERKVRDLTDGR